MLSLNTLAIESAPLPEQEPKGTVFVVDDDVSVRESLELLIRCAGWTAEMFGSAREFLSFPRADEPSCLVLDVNLPDQSGLDLQMQLTELDETMPVIFITGHADIPMTVRAMKAGAVDFLTKPFVYNELLAAIGRAIQRSDASRRQAGDMRALRGRYDSLTPRERQVMRLVASGLLNKQVGGELNISEITVKAHRGQVMRKMRAESLADLVRMTARLGIGEAPHHVALALAEKAHQPRPYSKATRDNINAQIKVL
jgi:FixJ family two-component response regulator